MIISALDVYGRYKAENNGIKDYLWTIKINMKVGLVIYNDSLRIGM